MSERRFNKTKTSFEFFCRRGNEVRWPQGKAMKASVATATRYDSVACEERNFSSSEERALALLGLPPQRSATLSIAASLFGQQPKGASNKPGKTASGRYIIK